MSRFYFAWVASTETTFTDAMKREDERVYAFSLQHNEGDFCSLSIDVRNPRVGLLAPTRKLWGWLAYEDDSAVVTALFFGRLVGLPSNLLDDICTLQFTAKPLDYFTQQLALAETLKVAPFYDPIFIDANLVDDPNTILEGYSALWHVDRTSLIVTVSDIIVGEDGEATFTADQHYWDNFAIALQTAPLASIRVNASVSWQQVAVGTIDFRTPTFQAEGLGDLISNWPKTGASLSSGWSVAQGVATDFFNIQNTVTLSTTDTYTNKESTHEDGDTMSISTSASVPQFNSLVKVRQVETSSEIVSGVTDADGDPPLNIPATIQSSTDYFPEYVVPTTLILQYNANRKRDEFIDFTLHADVQPILSVPEEYDHPEWQAGETVVIGDLRIYDQSLYVAATAGVTAYPAPEHLTGTLFDGSGIVSWTFVQTDSFSDEETIQISGRNVDFVMPDGSVPIVDVSRGSYFPTDRGLQSVQYLIAVARAHLLQRSRAVQISWDCRIEKVFPVSCRMNATVADPRLPGGTASGKIVSYSMKLDGSDGQMIGNVTIACPVGYGNAVTATPGSPTYISDDYISIDYFAHSGGMVAAGASDISFTRPVAGSIDDGLIFPLTKSQVTVHEDIGNQTYHLELRPVTNGPFGADYFLNLSKLVVPQGIDLEASS